VAFIDAGMLVGSARTVPCLSSRHVMVQEKRLLSPVGDFPRQFPETQEAPLLLIRV
jgi:hypothetical protein